MEGVPFSGQFCNHLLDDSPATFMCTIPVILSQSAFNIQHLNKQFQLHTLKFRVVDLAEKHLIESSLILSSGYLINQLLAKRADSLGLLGLKVIEER
jgi:hypothetical protein